MPPGSPILQFLRGMTLDELKAIQKRCDWCRVRSSGNKRDLSKRIRKSMKRSIDSGDLTYADAMRDIRLKVLIPRPESTEQTIRNTVRYTPVSTPVGDIRLVEEWFSAQLFGALDAKLYDPFDVFIEYTLNHRTHSQADLYVKNSSGKGDFLIEVKRAGQIANGNEVRRQIEKYHRDINQRPDLTLTKTFLCIIGEEKSREDTDESSGGRNLSDRVEVPSTLDDIESEFDTVEVVINSLGSQ